MRGSARFTSLLGALSHGVGARPSFTPATRRTLARAPCSAAARSRGNMGMPARSSSRYNPNQQSHLDSGDTGVGGPQQSERVGPGGLEAPRVKVKRSTRSAAERKQRRGVMLRFMDANGDGNL